MIQISTTTFPKLAHELLHFMETAAIFVSSVTPEMGLLPSGATVVISGAGFTSAKKRSLLERSYIMLELTQRLRQSLKRGGAFLTSARSADGLWRDFNTLAGQSSDWVTAFVAYAMKQACFSDDAIDSALSILSMRQRPNGGWAYNEAVPTDCDSTAWALLALVACPVRQSGSILGAAEFVRRHQRDPIDGGFSTYIPCDGIDVFIGAAEQAAVVGWTTAHTCVTSVALQALLAAGESPKSERIVSGLRYLARQQTAEGIWTSYWWSGHTYGTYHSVKSFCLAGFPDSFEPFKTEQILLAGQQEGGSWGSGTTCAADSFETAFAILALLECKCGRPDSLLRAAVWLLNQQNEDGSWPSMPILRIPSPRAKSPNQQQKWRLDSMGTTVIIRDQARLFTTAAVLWALAGWRSSA